tara:strand:- start:944 stop:1747 length:804 start_codon:yes stop_codon:yes gene_type:complete
MEEIYALVTGASSGIGREIANVLAKKGYNLILIARRKERLEIAARQISEAFEVDVRYITCDLSSSDSVGQIYKFCNEHLLSVGLIVNNAGYGISTAFHDTPVEEEEAFLRVLGVSVVSLTKVFLPQMLDRGEGKIMIISSVASYAPPSSIQSLYGPIKRFVNGFSDSLNANYGHVGISSTAVLPGYTVTEFHSVSGTQAQMDKVPSFMKLNAQDVAEEAVNDTLTGKAISIPSKRYKLIIFLLKCLPRPIMSFASNYLTGGRYQKKI